MRRALGFAKRWVGGLLLISITGWAGATDVRFVGPVGYSHLGTVLVLDADQIRSYASAAGTSASLRMELWATPLAFAGSFAGGYQLGAYGVSPLAAGASVLNVNSGGIKWNEPPSGLWYVTLVLTEQAGTAGNGGYTPRNWLPFPTRLPAADRHHQTRRHPR